MNFDVESLIGMMETTDPETIAKAFADALNEAIAEKDAQEEKEKMRAAKYKDAVALVGLTNDFIKDWYPELGVLIDGGAGIDLAQTLIDLFDELAPELVNLKKLFDMLGIQEKKEKEEPAVRVNKTPETKVSAHDVDINDVFAKFFGANGI